MDALWGVATLPTTATHFAVAAVTAAVAVLVLAADARRPWNQWLAFFLALVSANFAATGLDIWLFLGEQGGSFPAGSTRDLAATVRSLAFLFVIFDPTVLAYFASIFPRRTALAERWWGPLLLAAPVFLLVGLEIQGRTLSHPGSLPTWERALFVGYLATCYVYAGLRLLANLLEERSGVMARQIAYVAAGVLVVAFPRVALVARDLGLGTPGTWSYLADLGFRVAVLAALALLAFRSVVQAPPEQVTRAKEARGMLGVVGLAFAVFAGLWFLEAVLVAWSVAGAPASVVAAANFFQTGLTFSLRWFVFAAAILLGFVRFRVLAVGGRTVQLAGVAVVGIAGALTVGIGAATLGPWWGGALGGCVMGGLVAVGLLGTRREAGGGTLVASHGRRIELYRHLLAASLADRAEASGSRAKELEEARTRLGISQQEHDALLAVAQVETPGLPRPTALLGRFEVVRKVGAGGYANVYLAKDLHVGGHVVLKWMRGDGPPGTFEAALQELEVARRASHEHLVAIHDVVRLDDGAIVVMEHAAGGSLRDLLRRDGRLSPEPTAALLAQVLAGLEALHAAGLVHGDLKPENVLLTGESRVRLGDFGASHTIVRPTATRADPRKASGAGTPSYMAPERLEGSVATPASDLYAAGLLAREMLTGRAAPSTRGEAPPVPPPWQPFLERAVAPLDQRFRSAAEMSAALASLRTTLAPAPAMNSRARFP